MLTSSHSDPNPLPSDARSDNQTGVFFRRELEIDFCGDFLGDSGEDHRDLNQTRGDFLRMEVGSVRADALGVETGGAHARHYKRNVDLRYFAAGSDCCAF